LLSLGLSLCTSAALAWGPAHELAAIPAPPGCEVPPESEFALRYDVSFEGDIRPLMQAQNCLGCHGSAGGLSLSTQNVRNALLGPNETGQTSASSQAQSLGLLRVRPFEPYASGLLLKMSCEVPPYGARMPINGTPDRELVALIHDWIANGALMPDSINGERLFIGSFERIARP
jgi:hypothetical protein